MSRTFISRRISTTNIYLYTYELDRVGPIDNRLSTDKLYRFVRRKVKKEEKKPVTCDMWHVTHDTWHMTHDTWHVTCDMLWGVNILSKFQLGNFGSTITITIWWSCLVDNCYQPDRQRDGSRSNPWAGRGQAQGSGDWGMGELKVHLYSLTNDTLWKTLMHSLH